MAASNSARSRILPAKTSSCPDAHIALTMALLPGGILLRMNRLTVKPTLGRPPRQSKEARRHPDTGDQSKAPQPPPKAAAQAAGTPAMPDLLDPVALRMMPPKVAAFMLYEPREAPPWRRQ